MLYAVTRRPERRMNRSLCPESRSTSRRLCRVESQTVLESQTLLCCLLNPRSKSGQFFEWYGSAHEHLALEHPSSITVLLAISLRSVYHAVHAIWQQ
jgi:hypothetical protein